MNIPPSVQLGITREALREAPSTMGIYFYKKGPTILYIGKSVNLRARLTSHFENAKLDQKEAAIVHGADHIEYIMIDSEFKSLLLESYLIQRYKPQYNSRWRDDKSYLYIKITDKEEYPKLSIVHRERDKKSLFFGPFPSTRVAEEILKEMRKIFPYCTQKRITKHPCFYSKIQLCNPCPNVIESTEDVEERKKLKRKYRDNIRKIIQVLEGKTDLILSSMYKQLALYTKKEEYEEAIILRNKIRRFEFFLQAQLTDHIENINYNQSEEAIKALRHLLQPYFPELESLERIECYDISNTQLKQATASMVVLNNGLVNKSQYRRFKIKDEKLQSDFEMMEEMFKRRFKHVGAIHESPLPNNKWPTPNLIVVDGGKPQVRIIMSILAQMNIDIPLIGIAKHPDRFVIGQKDLPTIRPASNNPGFQMIRHLRDESHRFAKKYHVLLREKKML